MPKKIKFESAKYMIFRILYENKYELNQPLKETISNIDLKYESGEIILKYKNHKEILNTKEFFFYIHNNKFEDQNIEKLNYQYFLNVLIKIKVFK